MIILESIFSLHFWFDPTIVSFFVLAVVFVVGVCYWTYKVKICAAIDKSDTKQPTFNPDKGKWRDIVRRKNNG